MYLGYWRLQIVMKMMIVGITGSFGAGKSTVAGFFKKQGAFVFDADKIAHEALLKKAACYEKIVKIFGNKILKENGEIDRRCLGRIVFDDKLLLKKLCDIIHPYVIKRIKRDIKGLRRIKGSAAAVLDASLLIEAGLRGLVDKLIVVKAGSRRQIERCRKNYGLSGKEVMARIKSQMPIGEKIRFADFVIDNSKSKKRTRGEARKIWERIRPRTIRKKRI